MYGGIISVEAWIGQEVWLRSLRIIEREWVTVQNPEEHYY
ncbi:hypothetical protein E2C01_008917 [Portunus trituberculatus]|uniref:Uncharacterized protein n=1 Tax=Portunus trituberculatus TaxID=210409 RepID=A0A5B7D460_PORTR|nr:hypothetical protein [Portunus trituberculatus]